MVDSVTASLCFGYRSRREAIQLPHTHREREREREIHTQGQVRLDAAKEQEQNKTEPKQQNEQRHDSLTQHTQHTAA